MIKKTREVKSSKLLTGYKRRTESLVQRKKILVVCQGTKTEKYYFRGMNFTNKPTVICQNLNPLKLVEWTISQKESKENQGQKYNSVWCIFDKDESTDDEIDNARRKAEENSIKIGYSNISFEYWLLLHFEYKRPQVRNANEYKKILDPYFQKNFKKDYNKIDPDIGYLLSSRKAIAIKNGKTLMKELNMELDKYKCSPFTNIHELIQELMDEN
jgi:hypothetical protein